MFFNNNLYIKSVDLLVQDLEMMTSFYTNIIGLELISSDEGVSRLGIDNKIIVSLVENKHAKLNQKHTGLYHLAILLPRMSDLGKVINHIVLVNEYPLGGAADHLVSNAIYLDDPEGNGIEIYADNNSNDWEYINGEIEMATLPLDVNYIMEIRDTSDFITLPKGTILGHVHFTVNDISEAKKYFNNTLGFDLLLDFNSQAIFLSTNKYHHHIGANIWEGRKIKNRGEYDTGLISYHLNVEDKLAFKEMIISKGFEVEDNSYTDIYGLKVFF